MPISAGFFFKCERAHENITSGKREATRAASVAAATRVRDTRSKMQAAAAQKSEGGRPGPREKEELMDRALRLRV